MTDPLRNGGIQRLRSIVCAAGAGLAVASAPLVATAAPSPGYAQYFVTRGGGVLRAADGDHRFDMLLQRSRGILIVPNYGAAPSGVAGNGGEGIVLAHLAGRWSDPAFYKVGGMDVALPPAGTGGSVIVLLMSDRALRDVTNNQRFDLGSKGGLVTAPYSNVATAKPLDAIVWSDIWRAYSGRSLAATDVRQDPLQNWNYYGHGVAAQAILDGRATNAAARVLAQTAAAGAAQG